MADAAVGFLLDNLKQLVLYNAELIGDAKDQIEGLQKDLILLKAFLKDYRKKRINDLTLKAVISRVRRLVGEAEDVIDKYVVEKTKYKVGGGLRKAMHAVEHTAKIRNIAKEIELVRASIMEFNQHYQFAFQALQLDAVQDSGAIKKAPVVEEENVIGFDEEAEIVIKRLSGKDQDLDIITIVGMVGLGKTTLATKIYNDPRIKDEFFNRAWVYVSQKYKRKEVFSSILSNLTYRTDYVNKSDELIVTELREHLEKEKYLIVLDDVWTREAWDDLKIAFPRNNKGSKILITSRENLVARYANPTKEPLYLKFLPPKESWELLEKRVFGKGKCFRDDLKKLGQQIATECEGLPLAIVVMAGVLLNNRDSSSRWRQEVQDVGSFLVIEQSDVIALSYNHLPDHLKFCFLYLGVFRKDHAIPLWQLTRLWIAEGFIEPNRVLSLEKMAEGYVEHLINSNLLMVVERSFNGQIKTCRIHNMLRAFCQKEALEENFYQEIRRSDQQTLNNCRRICIHSGVVEYISSKPGNEITRSLLCHSSDEIRLARGYTSTISKAFELVRVLDIKSIIFEIFPKDLLQLALLRYLALSCNVKSLPSGFSALWNMQTLIFMTTSRTLTFGEEIWECLNQLRHLMTNAATLLRPASSNAHEGKENVQTLYSLSPESCTEQVLLRSPNIKKLGVRGNLAKLFEDGFRLFDNIGQLKYLTNLKLSNEVPHNPLSGRKSLRFPPADLFPLSLKKLTLSNTMFEWDYMYTVGKLEMLEELKLKDNAFKGKLWAPKDGGFASLKLLLIARTDLVTWKASRRHFPSLKCLVIQYCEKIQAVPIGLADIASFQELKLFYAPKAAASAELIQLKKLRKEGYGTRSSGGFKLSIVPPKN